MTAYTVGYLQVETTGLDDKFHHILMIKLMTKQYDKDSLEWIPNTEKRCLFINQNEDLFNTTYQKKHILKLLGMSEDTLTQLQKTEDTTFVENAQLVSQQYTLNVNEAQFDIHSLDFKELESMLNQCNVLLFNYASFNLRFLKKHINLKPLAIGCLVNDYLFEKHGCVYRAFDKLIELENKDSHINNTFSKFSIGCHLLNKNFKEILYKIKETTYLFKIESVPKYKNYFKDLDYEWEGSAFVKKVKESNLSKENVYLQELRNLKVPFMLEQEKTSPANRYK